MTIAQLREHLPREGKALSSRQREVVRLVLSGLSFEAAASELGITKASVQSHFYVGRARLEGRKPPASPRYQHDSDLDSETPREAQARVARELAAGQRCRHPMLSGAPCSLLLPCFTHGGQ
jgi:transposase